MSSLRNSSALSGALPLSSVGAAGLILLLACGGGGGGGSTSASPLANRPPAFNSTAPTVSKEGHAYTYVINVSDADGDAISLGMVASPSGATLDPSTRTLSWSPTAAQVGAPQSFDLLADDGKGGATHQTWSLTPTADAPPAFNSTAIQAGTTGILYSYTPTATDPDGDAITYRLVTHPSWAGISGGVVSGTPMAGGLFDFTLQADDGHGKTTDQSWTVLAVPAGNRPPVITSAPSGVASGGMTYAYTIQATDPDADPVTYRLVASPAGSALVGNVLTWTPSPAQERVPSTFTLQAVDTWGAASDPQTWSISPSGTIRGTRLLTYSPLNWGTGKVMPETAPDPGNPTIGALAAAAGGGFTSISGAYNPADGSFSVSQVPAGSYWLRINNTYIWTDQGQLDLGSPAPGRKDIARATLVPTNESFTITGMTPWNQGGDYLQFFDWNSRSYVWLDQDATTLSTPPATGATAIVGLTDDWAQSWTAPTLVDTSKGDHPVVLHMATRIAGATSYQIAKDVFEPASLVMADGVSTTVAGTFTPLADSTTALPFNWAQSAFARYQPAVSPSARFNGSFAYLVGAPDMATVGLSGVSMDLLQCFQSTSTQDVNLGSIILPVLPGHLDQAFVGYSDFSRSYLAPGATYGISGHGLVYSESTTLPTATAPFRPLVSPVQTPAINGQTFYADLSGAGVTPTLSWAAPAIGTPSGYAIYVYRVTVSGNLTQRSQVAALYTAATSLQLPPGILQAGGDYCFTIRAYAAPNWDPTQAPFRMLSGLSMGYAEALSGLVTP